MKYSTQLLLAVMIGAIVCLVVVSGQRPATSGGVALRVALEPMLVSGTSMPLADPLVAAKASLQNKLRQWQESLTQDPDNEAGRKQWLNEMLALLTDQNVEQIIRLLSPAEMKTGFGVAALGRWMQVDPPAASNWLAAQPDATPEQTAALADGWLGNQAGLGQYLSQLPNTDWKQRVIETVGAQAMVKDPPLALAMAAQMNVGEARTNLLRAIVSAWIDSNPEAAANWIANVDDPNLGDQLVAAAAQSYALTDPARAANWLVSNVKSQAVTEPATLNILSHWVLKDPAGAADWVTLFPNGPIKARAVAKVATRWRLTDPTAAQAWLQQLQQLQEPESADPTFTN